MKTLENRDVDDMNLVISLGSGEDEILLSKGYKFLGAGKDGNGKEVHVFQKEPLGKFQNKMRKIEIFSKKTHPDIG